MLFFGKKKRQKEVDATVQKASDIQEDAKIRVRIATAETEKLQRLIKRAAKNKDVTLTIFLATGGDRRIK